MPKTRSGKTMRRAIVATRNFADTGDIATATSTPALVYELASNRWD